MRKTKEVLRLKFELGLGLRQIARTCSLGLGTIHDYLRRAKAAGISWPLPEGWDEEKLESALFGATQARPTDPDKAAPDFAAGLLYFRGAIELDPEPAGFGRTKEVQRHSVIERCPHDRGIVPLGIHVYVLHLLP